MTNREIQSKVEKGIQGSLSNLKLYVWEDVLSDYTSGVMFALAEDKEHAKKMILEEYNDIDNGEFAGEPLEITDPKGFAVWGGA